MNDRQLATLTIVGTTAFMLVIYLMVNSAPAMVEKPSYTPFTTQRGHMSVPNKLGDSDFLCADVACDPTKPFKGVQTGRYYAERKDAILGNPIPKGPMDCLGATPLPPLDLNG